MALRMATKNPCFRRLSGPQSVNIVSKGVPNVQLKNDGKTLQDARNRDGHLSGFVNPRRRFGWLRAAENLRPSRISKRVSRWRGAGDCGDLVITLLQKLVNLVIKISKSF